MAAKLVGSPLRQVLFPCDLVWLCNDHIDYVFAPSEPFGSGGTLVWFGTAWREVKWCRAQDSTCCFGSVGLVTCIAVTSCNWLGFLHCKWMGWNWLQTMEGTCTDRHMFFFQGSTPCWEATTALISGGQLSQFLCWPSALSKGSWKGKKRVETAFQALWTLTFIMQTRPTLIRWTEFMHRTCIDRHVGWSAISPSLRQAAPIEETTKSNSLCSKNYRQILMPCFQGISRISWRGTGTSENTLGECRFAEPYHLFHVCLEQARSSHIMGLARHPLLLHFVDPAPVSWQRKTSWRNRMFCLVVCPFLYVIYVS